MDRKETNQAQGRLSPEVRQQLRYAINRAQSRGDPAEKLFANIVDMLEAPFVGVTNGNPSQANLMRALETLGAKAVGQVEYWHRKQMEYPCLDDYLDDDGDFQIPDDICPLLAQKSANGRYSEADWWLQTIQGVASDIAKSESVERTSDLKAFAKAMIACAFEGGDADGGFIQEKAIEFGLLEETVFDSAVHKDASGLTMDGEQWFTFADVLSGDVGGSSLKISADDRLSLIEGIRTVIPSMGSSSFDLGSSKWEFDPREGQGEALVFRPASANMIPFSTPIVVCRAPKLMDADTWRPVADYLTAVSPAAVSALLKAHDSLAFQVARMTLERDANDQLARANGRRAIEEHNRAEASEKLLAETESDRLEQARLNGIGGERELALMGERDRLLREIQRSEAFHGADPSEMVVVKRLVWTSDAFEAHTAETIFPWRYTVSPRDNVDLSARCDDADCNCGSEWRLSGPWGDKDGGAVYQLLVDAQAAAQADYETRVQSALGVAIVPSDWQFVPKQPYPEVVGAWYRYKNGHRFHDEPAPADTSDYGAYRAMLAAMPKYDWPVVRNVESMSVRGVDAALSKVAVELPTDASNIIYTAWKELSNRYGWHVTHPRPEQLAQFGVAILEALDAKKVSS
jgi:hypothetical protein